MQEKTEKGAKRCRDDIGKRWWLWKEGEGLADGDDEGLIEGARMLAGDM